MMYEFRELPENLTRKSASWSEKAQEPEQNQSAQPEVDRSDNCQVDDQNKCQNVNENASKE